MFFALSGRELDLHTVWIILSGFLFRTQILNISCIQKSRYVLTTNFREINQLHFRFRLLILFRAISPGVRFSKDPRKLLGPENFSGLFSGAFFGFRKAFLKAPEFLPKFSGMFSRNVTQGIARASISQPVIGSKIAIEIAALSWVRHVRIKFKTFSLNRP